MHNIIKDNSYQGTFSLFVALLLTSLFYSDVRADSCIVTLLEMDAVLKVDLANGTVGKPISVGSRPRAVAVTNDGATAYVVNSYDNTVSVINLATGAALGNPIKVGQIPWAIAATSNGKYALVANLCDNSVSVIDLATKTLACRDISVGSSPWSIQISPDNKKAYVTNFGDSSVSVIDVDKKTTIGTSIPVGLFPRSIDITKDGKYACVANFGTGTVSLIHLTNQSVESIPVRPHPTSVAITKDGRTLYVVSRDDSDLTIIDLETKKTIKSTVGNGGGYSEMVINPNGPELYLTKVSDNTVVVFDTEHQCFLDKIIPIPSGPKGISMLPKQGTNWLSRLFQSTIKHLKNLGDVPPPAKIEEDKKEDEQKKKSPLKLSNIFIHPDGKQALCIDTAKGNVIAIDLTTEKVIKTLKFNGGPKHITFSADGKKAYVVLKDRDRIASIDLSSYCINKGHISVGERPRALFISSTKTEAYVVNNYDSIVSVINLTEEKEGQNERALTPAIQVGFLPIDIASDGEYLYVVNYGGDSVSILDPTLKTTVGTIAVDRKPGAIAIDLVHKKGYVVNRGNNNISVLDLTTRKVVGASIPVGPSARGIVISPKGDRLYVVNNGDDTLSVIETDDGSFKSHKISIGKSPFGIAMTPDGKTIYIANRLDGTISKIDTATETVKTIALQG
ncbi:MAG: YncE family protein [Alphaproteobacteria bacterium]|nr:YncE family protein [Alphaproteobacteria bacterium]